MELAIRIQIEELPEGLYLATSDELPGLVAQGRTVAETLEIARDVARKLIEARRDRVRIPMMSISHSDLMPIRTERSDAGLSQCEIVIDIRQVFCWFSLS